MALFGSVIPSDAQGGHTFRNRFTNGDMRVWQRGTSFSSIGTSTFSADRWFSNYGGTAPTFSRSTDVPTGFQYSFSLAGSSTSYHGIGQRIESLNTADLSGQIVTLSFYAKLSSGTATGGLNISAGYANSVDNFGATTEFDGTNITSTIAGSWTRYTKTFTVPATAATNGFHVIVFCPGATQTFTLLLTGMQLERGSTATPFEFRPITTELQLCQRYFQIAARGTQGSCYSTDSALMGFYFPVQMRRNPDAGFLTGSTATIDIIGGSQSGTLSASGANGSPLNYHFNITGLSGRTSGVPVMYVGSNLFFSAELS
jgi:hypothetical protein